MPPLPSSARRALLALATAALATSAGCGSVNTTSTREAGSSASTVKNYKQINDLFTDIFLHVRDVREGRTPSGLLSAQVDVANDGFTTRHFAYRFDWKDTRGMVIQSQTSVWENAAVDSGTRITLSAIAPNRDATDFSIQVRRSD